MAVVASGERSLPVGTHPETDARTHTAANFYGRRNSDLSDTLHRPTDQALGFPAQIPERCGFANKFSFWLEA